MAIKCNNCGAELKSGANFCISCGTKVEQNESVAETGNGELTNAKKTLGNAIAKGISTLGNTFTNADQLKSLDEEDDSLWKFKGDEKFIRVYENRIIIESIGSAYTVLTGNYTDGKKTIYYTDIIGIQYKKPGELLRGYVQYETASMQMNNSASNFISENAFSFTKITDEMNEAFAYIEQKVSDYKSGVLKFFTEYGNKE